VISQAAIAVAYPGPAGIGTGLRRHGLTSRLAAS